jgi:hypothetical protein
LPGWVFFVIGIIVGLAVAVVVVSFTDVGKMLVPSAGVENPKN